MDTRRTALWALLSLLLVLSVVRFGYESNRIREDGFVDFPVFWGQALRFLQNGQAYPTADNLAQYRPGEKVYKFPPFYLALLVPLAKINPGSEILTYHWIAQILAYLGAAWLCARAVGSRRPALYATLLALLTLNFEPFFETLYGLQVETVLMLLVAASLLSIMRHRERFAGVALSLAAMLKLYPGFLLLPFLLRRRWQVVLGFGVGCLLAMIYSLVVIGPSENLVFFGRILPYMLGEYPDPGEQSLGIGRYLELLLGMTPQAAKLWSRWLALLPVALSVVLVNRSRRADNSAWASAQALLVFVPLLLLILPNSWSNYQLLLLPAFAVLLARVLDHERDRRALLALTVPAYALTLFSENTPYLLSVISIPEAVYQPILNLKICSSLLLWFAFVLVLMRMLPRARVTA